MKPKSSRISWQKLLQVLALLAFLAMFFAIFEKLQPASSVSLMFFFPSVPDGEQGAEIRYLTAANDEDLLLRAMIKELLLGPREIRLQPIFPVSQRLNNAIIDDKTAYVDLEGDFLLLRTEQGTPFSEQLRFLEQNVLFNFPQLERVIITIDGQQPGWPFNPAFLKYIKN